jgi:hypothetical protein
MPSTNQQVTTSYEDTSHKLLTLVIDLENGPRPFPSTRDGMIQIHAAFNDVKMQWSRLVQGVGMGNKRSGNVDRRERERISRLALLLAAVAMKLAVDVVEHEIPSMLPALRSRQRQQVHQEIDEDMIGIESETTQIPISDLDSEEI